MRKRVRDVLFWLRWTWGLRAQSLLTPVMPPAVRNRTLEPCGTQSENRRGSHPLCPSSAVLSRTEHTIPAPSLPQGCPDSGARGVQTTDTEERFPPNRTLPDIFPMFSSHAPVPLWIQQTSGSACMCGLEAQCGGPRTCDRSPALEVICGGGHVCEST